MQKHGMFYGAPPHIFEKARELRQTMTSAEQLLWEHLRNKQLNGYRFRRQHPISEFIADFYCHSACLVVEVDGGIHSMKEQKAYDRERNKIMRRFRIKVIRFTNKQVENDIEQVLSAIKKCLGS